MNHVVPDRKDHQSDNQHQPKPKSSLLDPFPQRTPQDCFASIVQKMAPVEDRNGKKVYQAEAYRNYSCQTYKRKKTLLGDFLRCPGYPQGAGQLTGVYPAQDHLSEA